MIAVRERVIAEAGRTREDLGGSLGKARADLAALGAALEQAEAELTGKIADGADLIERTIVESQSALADQIADVSGELARLEKDTIIRDAKIVSSIEENRRWTLRLGMLLVVLVVAVDVVVLVVG